MSFSDYLENKILDHVLRGDTGGTAFTQPAACYIGLFITNPTDANSGIEATGGSYARQLISFSAAAGGTISNSAQITFLEATADWGTVTHWGIYDALSAGNLLTHGAFEASRQIFSGDQLVIKAGELDISLD